MAISLPDKAVSEEVSSEQWRTIVASVSGLLLAIACMSKLWELCVSSVSLGMTAQVFGVLFFLTLCWLLSLQTPLWQINLLNRSSILLSELSGYFGFIMG